MEGRRLDFRDCRTRAGVRLRCLDTGARDGSTVLLLHGWPDSWVSFSRILPLLPPVLRVVVPDQRGHGDSDRPASGYSPDQMACDAAELLEALEVRSATVVGHSMGSFVAQRLAALAPEVVGRLVLVGSAATARNETLRALAGPVGALADPVDVDFVREFQTSTIHRAVPPEFMDRVIQESRKVPARVWKAALAGMLEAEPFPPVPAIRCPTLVVWGERDTIFGRADQEELLRRLPGSRLLVLPEVGHAPHWEVPEDFVRQVAF